MSYQNFWAERRVLVTGASGLLGLWITKLLLASGAYVSAFVKQENRESRFIEFDDQIRQNATRLSIVAGRIESKSSVIRLLESNEHEIVFHLAALNLNRGLPPNGAWHLFDTNVKGTYNLLEACRLRSKEIGCLVMASSEEVSALAKNQIRSHPYHTSKICAELICEVYRETYGMKIATVRLPNVYGGGDVNTARLVPSAIQDILLGISPVLRNLDSTERKFLYAEDAARLFLLVAENQIVGNKQHSDFHVSALESISTLALVERLIQISGSKGLKPVLNDERQVVDDSGQRGPRAIEASDVDWTPSVSLQEGLEKTFNWYKNNTPWLSGNR